jgi:hypothetical protein
MAFNSFIDGVVGPSARMNTPMGLISDGAGGVFFVSDESLAFSYFSLKISCHFLGCFFALLVDRLL